MVPLCLPRSLTLAAFLALQALIPTGAPATSAVESTESASLADLAWIAGDWVGREDDSFMQEQWSAPQGNDMMGMFRLIQGGKVVFYEFMTFARESSGLTLRIKHFDPGLVGWEEKDESIVFDLEKIGDNRAVFATEKDGEPERLIFERHLDVLVVTLEKPAKGTRTPFRYQLRKP